jgi:small basic protein
MIQPATIFPTSSPAPWLALDFRRVRATVYLLGSWLLVGAIVGLVQREQVGPDLTSALASIIAGMIVVPLFGSFTLFFGATWQDTLFGTALGSLAALVLASSSPVMGISLGAGHYILMGAMFAATGRPLAARCCRLLSQLPQAIGLG